MNTKLGIGIVVVAIVITLMLAGCVEEGKILSLTSTPTPSPKPEPKFSRGDVIRPSVGVKTTSISKEVTEYLSGYPKTLILEYSPEADKYRTIDITIRVKNDERVYQVQSNESWWSREFIECDDTEKVDHINIPSIMSLEEYWEDDETPTPSKSVSWHTVTTFSGGSGIKTTDSFTIKGDEWRIRYSVSPEPEYEEYSVFKAHVSEGGAELPISTIDCNGKSCSGTEYIDKEYVGKLYEGYGGYYIKIMSSSNTWELVVEDCY